MEKLKASEVRLGEHLRSLQTMITDLEKNCGESAVALLQVSLRKAIPQQHLRTAE